MGYSLGVNYWGGATGCRGCLLVDIRRATAYSYETGYLTDYRTVRKVSPQITADPTAATRKYITVGVVLS